MFGGGRENNYDLLRLISCIAVVLLHANWEYWGEIAYDHVHTAQWYFGSIINILTRFSVPCFAMLTGAFIMNSKNVTNAVKSNQKMEWKKLYSDVSFKIFLPMLIAMIIQIIIQIVSNVIRSTGSIGFIKYVITGAFANLWYFYMLAVLYFLMPVVVLIKREVSYKHYIVSGGFLLIWAIVSQATSNQHIFWSIGVVIPYVAYFMLGDILYEAVKSNKIKRNFRNVFSLMSVSILCLVITFIARLKGFNYYLVKANVNFFSPTIAIFSLCIFVLASLLDVKKNIYAISKHTFMIYVWHMLCMRTVKPLIDSFSLSFATSTYVLCISSLVMATVLGGAFEFVWRFVDKRLSLNAKWRKLKLWNEFM